MRLVFLVLALAGCTQPSHGAPSVYVSRCAGCHGDDGRGRGEARNLRDPAWQRSVSDDDLRDVIRRGGAARGLKSVMPANPQLSEPQLDAIVRWIRAT